MDCSCVLDNLFTNFISALAVDYVTAVSITFNFRLVVYQDMNGQSHGRFFIFLHVPF